MGLKPMNCPAHTQLYASAAALLPRPADPLLRAGPRAPPRAVRHAARPAARAPHHAGRRAHLLPPRTRSRKRSSAASTSASRSTTRFGFEPRLELSTRPEKRIGTEDMWDRAEAALQRALDNRGARVRAQRGRRRVLRPEDRPAHDRRDRPLVAARHGPARLRDARALRAHLHGRRQRRAPAGDDPPRADGLLRALHRHADRALRGRVPGLAGAGPGDRAAGRRPPRRATRDEVQARARASFRVEVDERTESIGRKIREAELRKIPYMLVVGDREVESGRAVACAGTARATWARCRSTTSARSWARSRGTRGHPCPAGDPCTLAHPCPGDLLSGVTRISAAARFLSALTAVRCRLYSSCVD